MAVVDLRCDAVPWACFHGGATGQHQFGSMLAISSNLFSLPLAFLHNLSFSPSPSRSLRLHSKAELSLKTRTRSAILVSFTSSQKACARAPRNKTTILRKPMIDRSTVGPSRRLHHPLPPGHLWLWQNLLCLHDARSSHVHLGHSNSPYGRAEPPLFAAADTICDLLSDASDPTRAQYARLLAQNIPVSTPIGYGQEDRANLFQEGSSLRCVLGAGSEVPPSEAPFKGA